jgi:hypothetical protein
MDQPRELVSRLADHVTAMANVITYEDAAAASAQSFIDFLPVDTVAQIRQARSGLRAGVRTVRGERSDGSGDDRQ